MSNESECGGVPTVGRLGRLRPLWYALAGSFLLCAALLAIATTMSMRDFPSDLDVDPPKKSRRHVADHAATQTFPPPTDDEWSRYLAEGGAP